MKLAALCCTYLRPGTLGQLIECFLRQDYPRELRELIILDDAGQYDCASGDGWTLVSVPRRFRSLGEKRNACAALASPDVEGFLVADDDDIYLPHWFSTHAEALKRADWSRPSMVYAEVGDVLKEQETSGLYHASWAYRKSAFDKVRGYSVQNNGEDQDLAHRLAAAGVTQFDPCKLAKPFFVHRLLNGSYHLSCLGPRGYEDLAARKATEKATLRIAWPRDFTQMRVESKFALAPHVAMKDNKIPVELIGPIDTSARNGPTNGMFALQRALRKRIAASLDWLTIKSLPVSAGALPWFWSTRERSYAVWWAQQGLPFVQGPNMLFQNSARPRIDHDECALLDAASCRAMFCHSEWYRDLIGKHRGPTNQAPIHCWPYPIEPWPGEPLEAKYDLLIYAKNGNRPQLLEHLVEAYPRNIVLHYGRYRREELYEAARQSRACAYLADDDHGPLALQEILLAGCPTIGVRTGAAFVRDGVTGMFVERMPPGRACLKNDADEVAFRQYLAAIEQAMTMDRRAVRAGAIEQFDTEKTVTRLLHALDELR